MKSKIGDMVSSLLLLLALLASANLVYLFRFNIRRWWRANAVNRDLPPHQRWPEILHWREGDEFEWSIDGWYQLISLTEDGHAYVSQRTDGHKRCVRIASLVGRNESLRDRRINQSINSTSEYMELIKQFNIAYAELQERDKKLKLVS